MKKNTSVGKLKLKLEAVFKHVLTWKYNCQRGVIVMI